MPEMKPHYNLINDHGLNISIPSLLFLVFEDHLIRIPIYGSLSLCPASFETEASAAERLGNSLYSAGTKIGGPYNTSEPVIVDYNFFSSWHQSRIRMPAVKTHRQSKNGDKRIKGILGILRKTAFK